MKRKTTTNSRRRDCGESIPVVLQRESAAAELYGLGYHLHLPMPDMVNRNPLLSRIPQSFCVGVRRLPGVDAVGGALRKTL